MPMKAIPFLFAISVLFGQPAATRLGEHTMGESFQQWLSISHYIDDLPTVCKSKKRADKDNCQYLINIRDGRQNDIGIGIYEPRGYAWSFDDNGRVTALTINIPGRLSAARPEVQQEIGFLVEAYGAPANTSTIPYQNSYGATWNCSLLDWLMPDGTSISAREHIGNYGGPRRELTITFLSKDYRDSELRKQVPKPNPYVK